MSAAADQAPQTLKREHGTKGTSPQTTLESGGTSVFPLVGGTASAADKEKFLMNGNHVRTGRRGLC